mmetsp:Transcript_6580/g.11439  ORF Transcript_6580/g.11439 Transcript_6580/m.11439 type:complete len:287 (+) Transcript_6580:94-954(+)
MSRDATIADEEQPLLSRAGVDLQPRARNARCCLGALEGGVAFTQSEVEAHRHLMDVVDVQFDSKSSVHEATLERLWKALLDGAYEPKSRKWQDLGFQGDDPRTDFRGGGFLALQCLCHVAEEHTEETRRWISEAREAGYEYFFAASAVNVCALLVSHLRLTAVPLAGNVKIRPACNIALKAVLKDTSDELLMFMTLFAACLRRVHYEWMTYCKSHGGDVNIMDFPGALQTTCSVLEYALVSSPEPWRYISEEEPMSWLSGFLCWIHRTSSWAQVLLLSMCRAVFCQ